MQHEGEAGQVCDGGSRLFVAGECSGTLCRTRRERCQIYIYMCRCCRTPHVYAFTRDELIRVGESGGGEFALVAQSGGGEAT